MPTVTYAHEENNRETVKDTLEEKIFIEDAHTRDEARAAVLAQAPSTTGTGVTYTLDRIEIGKYQHGFGFEGILYYKVPEDSELAELPEPGESFDYTGGQMHIKVALATTLPDNGIPEAWLKDSSGLSSLKLIGHNWDTNAIQGIAIPTLDGTIQFNETLYFRKADFTKDILSLLYRYRWTTNSAPWSTQSGSFSFDAGEVLYLGASGSLSKKTNLWTVNYRYAVGANRTAANDIVDGFTFDKKAHQYVDVYMDYLTSGQRMKLKYPVGVKVHTLYPEFDLNQLRTGVIQQ